MKGLSVYFSVALFLAQSLALSTTAAAGMSCLAIMRPGILKRIETGTAIVHLRRTVVFDEVERDSIATRLVHTEDLIDLVISKVTDQELNQEVQKIMDRYNGAPPSPNLGAAYLPGLTPKTNVTRVDEFFDDFRATKAAIPRDTSKLRHFYGNITYLVIMHRMMLDANEDTEANFEPWCEALVDARLVLELLNRLDRR